MNAYRKWVQRRAWQICLKRKRKEMEIQTILEEIRQVRGDVQALKGELERYKGFVGGVMWCMSALTAVVGFIWGAVSNG